MHLLYLIGQPGSGKSTLMRELVAPLPVIARAPRPVAHVRYPGALQLGSDRPDFPGTDALPMAVITTALPWLTSGFGIPPLVLAEGDRLACARFFDTLRDAGCGLTLCSLDAPDDVAAARRAARGSTQSPTWVQGRLTKHARLAARYHAIALDATAPPAELAATVRALPALAALAALAAR